ncbi:RNA-binding domain-containing protein [Mesorhizobium sp.]|uniref:RNA-binding domain-containing protein n=1 Tax=Mesorhizobium sp. TaxID=1871066 RepID=UPI0025E29433|nr:RNA-binding domain-containing protein [Mesorhizobium sp.]
MVEARKANPSNFMLPFSDLSKVTKQDLEGLKGRVSETRTLEFKREMRAGSSEEKIKFLAAVTSLANTAGGDLVIGIETKDGVASDVPGVQISNADAEKLRLEQLLDTGVDQRLPRCQFQQIEVGAGAFVLIIRVPRSWLAPHRVTSNDKFYGRNSAGKYPLDVSELRSAFVQSQAAADRIRSFRADRLIKIQSGETPLQLDAGGRLVTHVVPLSTFATGEVLDIVSLTANGTEMPLPPGRAGSSYSHGINLDGVFTFSNPPGELARAYCQAFRSGAVEGVDYLNLDERLPYIVGNFEPVVISAVGNYRRFLLDIGLGYPFFVFLSLTNAKGCRIRTPFSGSYSKGGGYNQMGLLYDDVIQLPDATLTGPTSSIAEAMRLTFNTLWNGFGFQRSPSYNEEGQWVGPPG